jgi:hypothetical protein
MNPNLVKVECDAPTPIMHRTAAAAFGKLREIVRVSAGVDFLARCGDIFRPAGFTSDKDGVANRSWHKTGRAFDYDQSSKALVLTSEQIDGRQFFRTHLICGNQTGRLGFKKRLHDFRGHVVDQYVFDFTAAAKIQGFERIPAWNGWKDHYNRMEFWHYQLTNGLTWAAAMAQISGSSPEKVVELKRTIGLNDRGAAVRSLQFLLNKIGLLPASEIDGVFGRITQTAVFEFQIANGLDADGIAGPITLAKLGL